VLLFILVDSDTSYEDIAMASDLKRFSGQTNRLQSSTCAYGLPQSEYDALNSFYTATDGDHWCNLDVGNPWMFPSNLSSPCLDNWIGITCICNNHANVSHISRLDFHQNCLFGELPSDIKNLTALLSLSISYDYLFGTIPQEITALSGLTTIYLSYNYLTGHIYSPVLQMPSLLTLQIAGNRLSGSLPDLTNASSTMINFGVSNNYLDGKIPSSIVKMKSLISFTISLNLISGSIPSSISGLKQLQILEVSANLITGSLPTISSMSLLQALAASENQIRGDLSPLANNVYLRHLSLAYNKLSGNLNTLTTLKRLSRLNLTSNSFVGSIPNLLFSLTSLGILSLSDNYLTSSLPTGTTSPHLQTLNLSTNYLTGTIPAIFYQINMISMDLSDNYFSGSIDTIFSPQWLSAVSISMNQNFFTGSFPSSISLLSNLQVFIMNDNLFSGIIPSAINQSIFMNNLYLYNNFFSSTIPPELGHLESLAFIWLSNNQFEGNLPQSLLNLPLLSQILVDNNQLTGNPFLSFNATRNPLIQAINIADNLFTGSIDRRVFDFPKLLAFSAVGNCLSGSLPEDICDSPAASVITVIALDGIGSNRKCSQNERLNRDRPPYVSGIFQSSRFRSSIPACFMKLPALQTLHLSGNELFSTIPEISSNSSLVDLSLSSNELTGSIPSSIQHHDFNRLDLFSNRLGGSLEKDFHISAGQTMLTLAVNRISGPLPSSIINIASNAPKLTELNILSSNIYSCAIDEIPQQDTYSESYSCGSYTLNVSSYVWVALVIIIAFVLFLAYRCLVPALRTTNEQTSTADILDTPSVVDTGAKESTTYTDESSDQNSMLAQWVHLTNNVYSLLKIQADLAVLWMLTATIPFQTVADKQVSMQRASVIDQTIDNPLRQLFHATATTQDTSDQIPSTTRTRSHARKSTWPTHSTITEAEKIWLMLTESRAILVVLVMFRYWSIAIGALLCLILIPIYIGLNATGSIVDYPYAYVLSIAFVHGYGPVIVCGVTLILILWFTSSIIVPFESIFERYLGPRESPSVLETKFVVRKYLLIYTFHLINLVMTVTVNAAYVNAILTNPNLTRNSLTMLQISVSIFKLFWNSIYIPWSTRKLIPYMSLSRNMQNRLIMSLTNFIVAPGIATLVTNQSCFYYAFVEHDAVTSSANITVCLSFFIDPSGPPTCVQTSSIAFFTSYYPPFQYSYACGTAMLVTYAPILLYSYIFSGLLVPLIRYIVAMYPQILKPKLISFINEVFFHDAQIETANQNQGSTVDHEGETESDIRRGIFRVKGRGVIVISIVHMTVLLTYGIACPLVGIAVAFSIINDSFIWKMLIGRYVSIIAWIRQVFHSEDGDMPTMPADLLVLERDCKDSWRGLFACYVLCVITITTFWALLFFDMVADPYSDTDGEAAAISFGIGAPLLLVTYHKLISFYPKANILLTISHRLASSIGVEQVLAHQLPSRHDKAHDHDQYMLSVQATVDVVEAGTGNNAVEPKPKAMSSPSIYVNRSSESSSLETSQANQDFAFHDASSSVSSADL
jgi:hypothetical protein